MAKTVITCKNCHHRNTIVQSRTARGDIEQTNRCGKCSAALGNSVYPERSCGGGS